MIISNTIWHSPVRQVTAKVELFEGSTLVNTFTEQDRVKSFDIQRVGSESKFFGFGVCQRLNIHFVDTKRELDVSTANQIKCYLNDGVEYIDAFPLFKVSEVHRDENTNEASVTAYDKLYAASEHTVAELGLKPPYTIRYVAQCIATLLGMNNVVFIGMNDLNSPFDINYEDGANFDGTELIRDVLDDIAEATQTVYYVDNYENLVFKMPARDAAPVYTILKRDYVKLSSKTNRRLSDIASVTELGDNVVTESGSIGTTQYCRENAFWVLRDDIGDLLNSALEAVGGLTINQFDCTWRGNPAIEIGDKIGIVTKDNEIVYSFLYDDQIKYTGVLTQRTKWQADDTAIESMNNPVTIGDALKKTYARVDKAGQEIELVAGELASIKVATDGIEQTVVQMDAEMEQVLAELQTKMTAEELSIAITQALQNVDSITTTTGYTFDSDGLEISRTDSSIKTIISEDGMTIYRGYEEILVADNLGVKAEDLQASTFLVIGDNSRFENYKSTRTACYYIR